MSYSGLFALHSSRSYIEIMCPTPSSSEAAPPAFRKEEEGGGLTMQKESRTRLASLRPFFSPRSVAVVGASRDPERLGHQVFQALLRDGFQGKVYPINIRADEVLGVPAYSHLQEVPGDVDLAVIVIPRSEVLSTVEDAAMKKVPALLVISAGFAEIGPQGKILQDQLLRKVRGYGMRMVGPNCMGLLNTDPQVKLNASFSTVFPPPGRVAMSSQSGALGLAIVDLAARLGIGLNQFVSVGNKADVSTNDLLQYWEKDPQTDLILLYLESFGNPRKFSRIARRVARHKPIVVVKSGRTSAGQRAAGSHTAALASSETLVEALFQQSGVIRADTLKEMFDLAKMLAHQPLLQGQRVVILTNSGGPGILCADACSAAGLDVPQISSELQEKLRAFLPAEASVKNPIDMVASASTENYRKALEILLTAQEADVVVVIYIPVGPDRSEAVARAVLAGSKAALDQGIRKPVLMNFLAGNAETHIQDERQTIPVYAYPEDVARVLGKIDRYTRWLARKPGRAFHDPHFQVEQARRIVETAKRERGGGWLSALETRELLKAFGIQMPPGALAKSPDEAAAIAEEIGYPVAAKLSSLKIIHKTEMGGVALNIQSEQELREAFRRIQDKATAIACDSMEGILVQPMVQAGVEVMAGLSWDPSFGPLIAFGLGGIFVEILQDVQFRLTPLTDREAREMIEGIRGFPLLQGYRGHPAGDVEALQDLLLRFSALAELLPEIHEGDLNPIFALPPGQGYAVVDARLRIE